MTERNAVNDYNNQDRIILGGPENTLSRIKIIFNNVFPNAKIIKTDSTTAESVKYMTNAFLSVKVSFANEMYKLAKSFNMDANVKCKLSKDFNLLAVFKYILYLILLRHTAIKGFFF